MERSAAISPLSQSAAKLLRILRSAAALLLISGGSAVAQGIVGGGSTSGLVAPPPVTTQTSTFNEDTTSLLYNPNVGLVSNNGATGSSRTNPNGYPIPIMETRYYWRDLESTRDTHNFSTVQADAVKARADLQTLNVRLPYLGNVGDCGTAYSDPTWMTDADLSGWTATHDECGTTYNYLNFEDPDVRTEFVELITSAESAMSSYPAWRNGFLETGYGAYGENNYSGTICATTVNGADACSVGSEIPQYLIGEVSPWYDAYIGVSTTIRKMNMVDNEDLFDYIYDTYTGTAGGTRADCWGWQEAATANCPTTGPWMCGIYPRTFAVTTGSGQTASHSDQDLTGMIFLESCGSVSTWDASYDYASSFSWALSNGASALNVKGFYDGSGGIDTVMTSTLRTLGYRYFLDEVRNLATVTAGNNLSVEIDVSNRGVAPDYDGMVWMVKFVEQGGGSPDIYRYTTAETLGIAAGASVTETLTIPIPAWLDAATYDVYVGAGFDNLGADYPEIRFAVTANPATRWYQATTVTVANGSPSANPTTDYAGQFTAANSEFLSIADSDPISMNGTDFTVAVRVRADTLSGRVIAAKGDVGSTGQEWSLFTDGGNSQRFTARVSTGSLRTTACNTFGNPSTGTWYWVLMEWNNTAKTLKCSVNNGTEDSNTFSGSISNTSNAFRLGTDTVGTGRYWDGRIDKFRLWKRVLSSGEKTSLYNGGNPLTVEDFDYELRRGLYMAAELDEVSGNRSDAFQHWTYVDNGTVTQASSN